VKIATVTVDVLRVPVARPYLAGGRTVVAHWHVLARLRTSDGVEGAGYIVYPHGDLMSTIATAARELGTHLTGMSVLEPEAAWDRLARRADWVGPGGLLHLALAPLDIAIWDAAGKTLGQPLHRLLGGHRDRLPVYASDGLWYNLTLDELAASARRHTDAGFPALKLRLGKAPSAAMEARRVQAVREAVGPDVRIMVDINESWTLDRARRTGRVLQEAGIAWLEDPVRHQDVSGLAELREHLDVPIAAGERLYHVDAIRGLLEARAVDVLILDLARVGGVTPWRTIAALARAYHVPVCGHVVPEVHAQRPPGGVRPALGRHPPRDAAPRARRAGGLRRARARPLARRRGRAAIPRGVAA
jgi:L-alanine-DL-glutamate epimerase-like enolase superfamily enzyme